VPLTEPLLYFLGAVGALIVLTGGLGISLALAFYLLDYKLRNPSGPLLPAPSAAEERLASRLQEPRGWKHRTAGPGAAMFALVILLAGVLIGRYVRLTPAEASIRAGQVDLLFNTMLGIAAAIFLLVEGILVVAAIRYRRKKGDDGDGLPIHGSHRLEIAWTLVPTLIVLWLGVYSYQIFAQIRTPPQDAMTVEVISRQFQWEFRYPEAHIIANDLYLPEGQAVRLRIRSEDVLHSFWVPEFRVKQDAIPMRETEVYFTPHAVGRYRVVCAELCGVGHARMGLISHVVVQSRTDFDAWVAEQQAAAGRPPDPVTLFARYGCNACHALAVAGAEGQVGPSLDGIGTLAATRLPGVPAEAYIRQSILDPDAFIAPECPTGPCPAGVMPRDFAVRLPPPHLDALVNFLLQQR
jgi:cytochrome c oxidase subunit 2